MANKLDSLISDLKKLGNAKRAEASKWFFKTGPGEYGEGDEFLGIAVGLQRKTAYKYLDLELADIQKLLQSKIHEHRFVAVEILVAKYERGDSKTKKAVFNFYLNNIKHINNWDLVDTSAGYIVGDYLLNRSKAVLYKLVKSKNLWARRVAIISTLRFVAEKQFADSLKIMALLLGDSHDLIHKASGWVLREIGKRSVETEIRFLDRHCRKMPRTMLRYALEKFPKEKREYYLKQKQHRNLPKI